MKKNFVLLSLAAFLLLGCENQEETVKSEYIAMKSNLQSESNYTSSEDLPLDVVAYIDRVDAEQVTYKVVLVNPKEDMYELKAMVIHNYYSDDVYPSIGLFDETGELLVSGEEEIAIEGTIETTKDISQLQLELKIWIEYVTEDGEVKDIYYKAT